jgi:hypothetical protein
MLSPNPFFSSEPEPGVVFNFPEMFDGDVFDCAGGVTGPYNVNCGELIFVSMLVTLSFEFDTEVDLAEEDRKTLVELSCNGSSTGTFSPTGFGAGGLRGA